MRPVRMPGVGETVARFPRPQGRDLVACACPPDVDLGVWNDRVFCELEHGWVFLSKVQVVLARGPPRALPAAGRVARRDYPAPALALGWLELVRVVSARSVAAYARGPPSSTSASTSCLSPAGRWRAAEMEGR